MRRLLLALVLLVPLASAAQDAGGPGGGSGGGATGVGSGGGGASGGGAADFAGTAFSVRSLNTGLPGIAPQRLATPQATLETFLAAAARADWRTAAQTMDLGGVPAAEQPSTGAALADQLAAILERRVVLRWGGLSERPDALVEEGGDAPLAGEARRSLLIGVLDLGDRPVAVRLNRVAPEGGEPVWVFARSTVENVGDLYAIHGPSELERALPGWLRQRGPLGLHLWELILLPAAAVLVVGTAVAVWRAVGWVADRVRRRLPSRLIRAGRLPLTIAVAGWLLSILTTELFVVSSLLAAILEPTILLLFVGAAMLLGVNTIEALLDRIVDDSPETMSDPDRADMRSLATGVSAARRVVILAAVLLGAGIVLASANIFRSLGVTLIASAGVLTLVLGFAAREVLGNIIASLQILLNRSARIGDQLLFEGTWVTVERIHFTYVQLRIWTGNRLVVPVSYFVSKPFENWSHVEVWQIRPVHLKFAHTVDVDRLRRHFFDYIRGQDEVEPVDEADVYVTAQDAFGVEVRFQVPVPNPSQAWDVECRVREHMLAFARDEGLDLPTEPARMEAG